MMIFGYVGSASAPEQGMRMKEENAENSGFFILSVRQHSSTFPEFILVLVRRDRFG
jgi:hypothetical protein